MTEFSDLVLHPEASRVLEFLDGDELSGSGDRTGGITTEFYRRLVVGKGGKEIRRNVELRRKLILECSRSEGLRKAVWTACSRDILFWVNMFAFTYDPRNTGNSSARGLRRLPKTLPFVTWPYQDDALRLLQWCVMNGVDGLIEKSRDMGASWIFLTLFDWFFLFRPMETFLMVSRKEDLVDKREDPDALFWKIDFINRNLPGWMSPTISRSSLHMRNESLGSTIDGESTTGDVGRGGRRTAMGLDEFAAVDEAESQAVLNATNDTTECRIFNSTPKGSVGAYYDQTKRDDILKIRMHWTQHPHKMEGLYYCERGKCPLHPEGGKPHSPWYDRECRRRGWNPVAIAQELDIDYSRAGGAFFSAPALEDYSNAVCRPRLFRGELDYDVAVSQPEKFREDEAGCLRLWFQPTPDGSVPSGEYGVGVDISEGTGASFSCFSVVNFRSGEKVAEYANPSIKPYEFARYVVATARKFGEAKIAWEANGPGREFGDEVMRQQYGHIYYRTNIATKLRSQFPGWVNLPAEKQSLFGAYRRALAETTFMNRSRDAIKECFKYATNADGTPEYQGGGPALGKIGQSHGDLVVADCLANMLLEEARSKMESEDDDVPAEVPENCLYRRMQEARMSEGNSWLKSRLFS